MTFLTQFPPETDTEAWQSLHGKGLINFFMIEGSVQILNHFRHLSTKIFGVTFVKCLDWLGISLLLYLIGTIGWYKMKNKIKFCSLYCLFEFQNFMLEFFVALIIVDLFLRIHKGLELSAHDKSLSQIKQISGVAQLF